MANHSCKLFLLSIFAILVTICYSKTFLDGNYLDYAEAYRPYMNVVRRHESSPHSWDAPLLHEAEKRRIFGTVFGKRMYKTYKAPSL